MSFTSRSLQLNLKRVNYSFGQMKMYLVSETYERDAEVVAEFRTVSTAIQRRRQVDAKRSIEGAPSTTFKKFPI